MGYYGPSFYSPELNRGLPKGDPGFLSFFGKAIKGVGSVLGGVLPGGGLISKATSMAGSAISAAGRSKAGTIAKGAITVAKSHPVLTAAGGAAAVGALGAGVGMMHAPAPAGGMTIRGGMGGRINPRTGLPMRRRHMRVTNVRALHRALRRAEGFERLAKRVLHVTSPHKRHVFKGFRKRRKAR